MERALGSLKVTGDFIRGADIKEQHDDQIFIEALNSLLNQPKVVAVRWRQYTPHFNDGDPCVFSPDEAYVKLEDGDTDDGDYEDGFVSGYDWYDYPVIGTKLVEQRRYDYLTHNYKTEVVTQEVRDYKTKVWHSPELERLGTALSEFNKVLQNGHHYVLLLDTFGDHCEVTATLDGIEVREYDHD